MSMSTEKLATLTIAAGTAVSDKLSDHLSEGQMKIVAGALEQLSIVAPAALTNAVALEVSDTYGGTTKPLEDYQGNGIAIPAGVVTGVPYVTFKDLMLRAAGNEAAERTFVILGKLALPAS